MTRDDVILRGGPMAGYRVPTERIRGDLKPIMAFLIHTGPRAEMVTYLFTGFKQEFVRDVPIYTYVGHSIPGA
jgi:hypothetical protein